MADARILIVEDEPGISEPLTSHLAREGFLSGVASTIEEARAAFIADPPDLVLLDVMLPDGDGRDLCRELRASSDVPIIMLTARGEDVDKIVGLELGADDYVVKPFSAAEVISRIRAVLRRSAPRENGDGGPSLQPVSVRELELDPAARIVRFRGEELELSRKEFDLLATLMQNAGRVVKREDLMSEVWDTNWFGSTKTLDVHIGWLRRKLDDDHADPTYIETVRGVGFRFAAPEDGEP